jgi:rare lipoprotein A
MPASRKPLRTMRGKASYYSDKFSGRKTASGEPYDPSRRTAASRDLPFGTILRVIRQDTGAQVIVRVNDRGPFNDKRRLLDLSRAAAKQLDMIGRGVISVKVEVLELGKPAKRKR